MKYIVTDSEGQIMFQADSQSECEIWVDDNIWEYNNLWCYYYHKAGYTYLFEQSYIHIKFNELIYKD